MSTTGLGRQTWTDVCALDDLEVDRGAAVIVGDRQFALFRTADDELYAIANRDPFSGANVLARGLIGSAGTVVYVASPMLKQRFDLCTGQCLDDPDVRVALGAARVAGGRVQLAVGPDDA